MIFYYYRINMTELDDRSSIGDLNLQSTHDLPTNKLWWNKEDRIISRWINFKGWICTIEDIFETLFWYKKSVNTNDENTLTTKE